MAQSVPRRKKASRERHRAAIKAIRKLASKNRLGEMKIKELITEGRR